MGKSQKDIVILANGEQEREIENPQVLSVSSKSRNKRTYVWEKAKRTHVFLAIGDKSGKFRIQRCC